MDYLKLMRILTLTAALALSACVDGSAGARKSVAPTATEAPMTNTKKPDPELLKKLTPEQIRVTQQCGTEPPFKNAYWDHHEPGIYVDVVSGEALFSSLDKFDSGSGWPSFTQPIDAANIEAHTDRSHGMERTEIKSKSASSHLGHVFDDGPGPTHQRFCINSASLKFVHVLDLEEQGYGKYLSRFPKDVIEKEKAKRGGKSSAAPGKETAILAGGCFWGVEDLIRKMPGVLETEVGYTGGNIDNPVYEQVKTGKTGHAEAIRVVFDPAKLSYDALLAFFFRLHDPTTLNQQGNDRGTQYRSAIYYENEAQKKTAEAVKARVDTSGKWKNPVVTEITKATKFYPAEGYHQDYLVKNPGGYTCHWVRD